MEEREKRNKRGRERTFLSDNRVIYHLVHGDRLIDARTGRELRDTDRSGLSDRAEHSRPDKTAKFVVLSLSLFLLTRNQR